MVRKSTGLKTSTSKAINNQENTEEMHNPTSVKKLVDEAIANIKSQFDQELNALKAELLELKTSQAFICNKYDLLQEKYNALTKTNKEQEVEISNLKAHSSALKNQCAKDEEKLDNLEQYGRRQNLEIIGIPQRDDEDTNSIVIEVAKMMGVKVLPEQISTSHRMPVNPKKNSDQIANPPIIARFTNHDVKNQIYANRKLARSIDLRNFSISGTKNIYVNENLTVMRKRLFWQTKQKAKEKGFKFFWTMNGNIFVRKSDDTNIIAIKCDQDLKLIE